MLDFNFVYFNKYSLMDEPIDTVLSIIESKKIGNYSYIVTPNVDHFYRLDDINNSEFIASYDKSSIRVCDSRIIQKISYMKKPRIDNVVPGSDLTRRLLESDWIKSKSLFIVGPDESDVEFIRSRYSLRNLNHHTPPMGFINDVDEVLKCIDVIKSSKSDIILLAVGSPQQEVLAYRLKCSIEDSSVCDSIVICIGASLDFLSGKINRAPVFLQWCHLEWLHRALSSPKRLVPRYWKNLLWIFSIIIRK